MELLDQQLQATGQIGQLARTVTALATGDHAAFAGLANTAQVALNILADGALLLHGSGDLQAGRL